MVHVRMLCQCYRGLRRLNHCETPGHDPPVLRGLHQGKSLLPGKNAKVPRRSGKKTRESEPRNPGICV